MLQDIAEECPMEYGIGVHLARALLLAVDSTMYEDGLCATSPFRSSKEPSSIESLRIIPNPNDGDFLVGYTVNRGKQAPYTIMDLQGQRLKQGVLYPGLNYHSIRLGDQPPGTYIMRVTAGGRVESAPFILTKRAR